MPDNTQLYSSCNIKLCEWCTKDPKSGYVQLENKAGKLYLATKFETAFSDEDSDY